MQVQLIWVMAVGDCMRKRSRALFWSVVWQLTAGVRNILRNPDFKKVWKPELTQTAAHHIVSHSSLVLLKHYTDRSKQSRSLERTSTSKQNKKKQETILLLHSFQIQWFSHCFTKVHSVNTTRFPLCERRTHPDVWLWNHPAGVFFHL